MTLVKRNTLIVYSESVLAELYSCWQALAAKLPAALRLLPFPAGISENASEELPEKNRHNLRGCQQKSRKIAPFPGFDTGSAL